jgi:beta-1,4-mannooligosaccharide/beta-1,4-mannosyl-N-acetylglucosamine phosphorylase
MGAAILDTNQPDIVKYRSRFYLLAPAVSYELTGDVPNVIFPCAALHDEKGRVAIYYGAADTVIGLAFGYIHEIIDYIKNNSL